MLIKNKPAEEAFRVATGLAKLFARLDSARDSINDALDNLPEPFDTSTRNRLAAIRSQLHREISLILDLSKREAHRICHKETYDEPEQLKWTDDTVPDCPGLWAFMSPQNDHVYYQPVSQEGADHPERWERGRWCRVGQVPSIGQVPIIDTSDLEQNLSPDIVGSTNLPVETPALDNDPSFIRFVDCIPNN